MQTLNIEIFIHSGYYTNLKTFSEEILVQIVGSQTALQIVIKCCQEVSLHLAS